MLPIFSNEQHFVNCYHYFNMHVKTNHFESFWVINLSEISWQYFDTQWSAFFGINGISIIYHYDCVICSFKFLKNVLHLHFCRFFDYCSFSFYWVLICASWLDVSDSKKDQILNLFRLFLENCLYDFCLIPPRPYKNRILLDGKRVLKTDQPIFLDGIFVKMWFWATSYLSYWELSLTVLYINKDVLVFRLLMHHCWSCALNNPGDKWRILKNWGCFLNRFFQKLSVQSPLKSNES